VAILAGGLVLVVLLYGLILLWLYVFQRRLLFRPEADLPPPEQFGLHDIAVPRFAAADGNPLFAWYAAPARPDGYVVLYLHGNAGHIGYRAHRAHRLMAFGWGVCLLEYRGFGGNPGQPSETGLLADASAGLAMLHSRGIRNDRILLWGESLGTNLAIALATGNDVAAVLLESPYTSIAAAAQLHYPYAPAARMIKDRFDSLALIPRVRAPILIMQGALDTLVPPAMGRALAEAATAPVELWTAPEAGHNDLAQAGATEAAVSFVHHHLPP